MASYACAAKHLCKMLNTPLDRGTIQHWCMNCQKPMHGALCGVIFSERGSLEIPLHLLTNHGKSKVDSIGALLCSLCINAITLPTSTTSLTSSPTTSASAHVLPDNPTMFEPITPSPMSITKKKTNSGKTKVASKRSVIKKSQRTFSAAKKLQILREVDEATGGRSQQDILHHHGTNQTSLFRWRSQRAKLEKAVEEEGKGSKKKILSFDPLGRIKDAIKAFYDLNNKIPKDARLPITGKVISHQALLTKNTLLEKHNNEPFLTDVEVTAMEEFKASLSWSWKTAKAFGWKSVALHGEAGSVDIQAIWPEIDSLKAKIATYNLDNVYNMDETGLFFKCLPNCSYVEQKDSKLSRGTKQMKAKDRVTLYVCVNATGTDKMPLSIIGKSAKPRCFKNIPLKMMYFSQAKAWSDTKTFMKWWHHFLIHIRGKTNAPTLLILDNCGPHGAELVDPFGQVTVVFLPPNCTSVFQPMDAGVIAALKKNYRYRLLRRMLEIFEERTERRQAAKDAKMAAGTMGLNEGHPPHLVDVMDILHDVWKEVTEESVRNCWVKSSLVSKDVEMESDNNAEAEQEMQSLFQIVQEFKAMCIGKEFENAVGSECEFDEILEEMLHAFGDCDKGDSEAMKAVLESWIRLEDTNFCKDLIHEEVHGLMDIDSLLGFNVVDIDCVKDIEEEGCDSKGINSPARDPSIDEVNEIVVKMKSLSEQVGELSDEYGKIVTNLNDCAEMMRRAFSKSNFKKQTEKSFKEKCIRQANITPFLSK